MEIGGGADKACFEYKNAADGSGTAAGAGGGGKGLGEQFSHVGETRGRRMTLVRLAGGAPLKMLGAEDASEGSLSTPEVRLRESEAVEHAPRAAENEPRPAD
ncbi:hypothetical protein CRG98_038297 [Punica granatum]|uniref:Uncharacterized protein n=1 Tax=Punica granatum TaxID=22663 RepID=A0A2I0IBD8_PUNGR|nr:hypothetical protein CRG98_038297 [Punica granatum]